MTSVCFGTAGVPPSGEPGRQGMSARQETIDRYRHFRAIAKQHLGGGGTEASQQDGDQGGGAARWSVVEGQARPGQS